MKTESILANMGWPFDRMDRNGMLRWGPEELDGAAFSAFVIRSGDKIEAVATKVGLDGGRTRLELEWSLGGGQAVGIGFSMNGTAVGEDKALSEFQNALTAFESEPRFDPTPEADGPKNRRSL